MAAGRVLLECRRNDGRLGPEAIEAAVQLIVKVMEPYGFVVDPASEAYVRDAENRPPTTSGAVRPSLLYVAGTMSADFPVSGAVVDPPWHIRIFADLPIGGRGLPAFETATLSTEATVRRLLGGDDFTAKSLTGKDVAIAILDDGINLRELQKTLPAATLDEPASISKIGTKAGLAPISHGTMCAYDALIMAPNSTLIDLACLKPYDSTKPGQQENLINRVHRMYTLFEATLRTLMSTYRAIVINNSWAIVNARNDPGPTHPSGYIGNPEHPLNKIVAEFVNEYCVDVLFAAGNCRPNTNAFGCQQDDGAGTIYGANSLQEVLTVTAINVDGSAATESSHGPGRLYADKPDVCMYSNFVGAQLEGADTLDRATSAACAVTAGLVACIRTKEAAFPLNSGKWTPARVNDLIRSKTSGGSFNHQQGRGPVDGPAIAALL